MSLADPHQEERAPESFAGPNLGASPSERKWPIGYDSIEPVTVLTDVVLIVFASLFSGVVYHLQAFGALGNALNYLGSAIVVAALFVLWMKSRGMYNPAGLLALRSQIAGVCAVWAGVFFLLAGAVFALKIGEDLSRGTNVLFAAVGLCALVAHRIVWQSRLVEALSRRKLSGRKVVLITDHLQFNATDLRDALTRLGFRLERHFTFPPAGERSRDEMVSQVIASVRGSDVQEIMVGADLNHLSDLRDLIADLRVLPFPVSLLVPVGPASEVFKRCSRVFGNTVCIELQRGPLSPLECALKRCVDIAVAGAALIVLSPLLIAVTIAIKLDTRGPVLFRQRRCGFNGRCFQIFKFRTMSVLEDGGQVRQAQQGDRRVTRVGRFLRRTSIDELPQLLNVLAGSMSLVGPRPHAVAHDIEFDKMVRNYAFRHRVKPGLTGWAQVNGCRGPTPTRESIERRVEYDLWYIDNWSFRLDFSIMLQTAVELVRGRNAY